MKVRVVHYSSEYYKVQYQSGLLWHDVMEASTYLDIIEYTKLSTKIGLFDQMKRFAEALNRETLIAWNEKQQKIIDDQIAHLTERDGKRAARTFETEN